MAELRNFEKVVNALRTRAAKARTDADVSVAVGYTQSYAIYVHENLQAYHHVGQAKFLEEPFRQYQDKIMEIIRGELAKGRTLAQALVKAGLFLQRESQQLCPVDTGALKNSAFTRLENR